MLVGLAAMAAVTSACGGVEELEAGAPSEVELPADSEPEPEHESESDVEQESGPNSVYVATESNPDLISARPAPIAEVRVVDDQTLGVRYESGSEPCVAAFVTVTETDVDITLALRVGLDPNAAAMGCIDQVFDYEIQVTLDQPIADRSIVTVST